MGTAAEAFSDDDEDAGLPLAEIPQYAVIEEGGSAGNYFASRGESSRGLSRAFTRTVQKEWKVLRDSLPGGVYVRVYEDRQDLMRAAIIGPSGTAYADGVFVFDLFLPPDYPTTPPEVYFHAYGMRLNPNLYDNGRVCLSILGTWSGKGVEQWNPKTGSVLQVLVSILGLVLVAEPYYNEAGYENQVDTAEGHRNSRLYNETTQLLVYRHMVASVSRPVAHVRDVVFAHFRERGHAIMDRLDDLLSGARGIADEDPQDSEVGKEVASDAAGEEEERSSAGFRASLGRVRGGLVGVLAPLLPNYIREDSSDLGESRMEF